MEAKEDYSTSESDSSNEEISTEPKATKTQPIAIEKSSPTPDSRKLDESIALEKSLPKDQTPGQVLSKDIEKTPPQSKFKVDSLTYYKDQARTLGIKGFSKKSKKVLKELVAQKLNPEKVSSVNSEEVLSVVEPSTKLSEEDLTKTHFPNEEQLNVVEPDAREKSIISKLNGQLCDQLRQMCRDCSPRITISKYDSSLKMT